MKRFFTLLFTALLLTAALCVSASASQYNSVAQDLSAIGMFRGTGNGFDLDRAPTRSEAAIMLVRLYGAEDKAKAAYDAGEITHPFTDVSAYTSPYVAWLYTNGITNGTSATTFGSGRACTLQNYVVFLLRALGYKDGTDFQYAQATNLAQTCGFYTPLLFDGTFLRDDLAALTYQALAANVKGTDTSLLASLIASGAIDKTAAKPLTDKIDAYRALVTSTSGMESHSMDLDTVSVTDMTIKADGKTTSSKMTTSSSTQSIINGSDIRMAVTSKTTADGTAVESSSWIKDGWLYTATAAEDGTTKIKLSVGDDFAELEDLVQLPDLNVSGLATVKSISSRKSGTDTVYTLVVDKNTLNGLMDSIMTGMLGSFGSMDDVKFSTQFSDMTIQYTVGSQGALKGLHTAYSAAVNVSAPATADSPAQAMTMNCAYDTTVTVKATGSAVKITFPDFSDFVEIDMG